MRQVRPQSPRIDTGKTVDTTPWPVAISAVFRLGTSIVNYLGRPRGILTILDYLRRPRRKANAEDGENQKVGTMQCCRSAEIPKSLLDAKVQPRNPSGEIEEAPIQVKSASPPRMGTISKRDVARNLHAVVGTKSEAAAFDQTGPKARNLR